MATGSAPPPREDTSLLQRNDSDYSGRGDPSLSQLSFPPHHLSSGVIKRTSVIFEPDLVGADRNSSTRISFSKSSSSEPSELASTSSVDIVSSGDDLPPGHMISSITTTSILNLVVATAGGIGMVTLPGSFAQLGWLEGTLMLMLSSAAAASSLFLLNWACNTESLKESKTITKSGNDAASSSSTSLIPSLSTSSYASLVAHTLGNTGSQTLELLTLTYCIGQVVAYLGAIGGQVHALLSLFGSTVDVTMHDCIGIVALGIMFPLSLLPEEGAMKFAGVLGTICMVYIATAVVLGDGLAALHNGGICSLDAATNSDATTSDPVAFTSSYITLMKQAPIFLFSMNASVTYVPVRYQHLTCLGKMIAGTAMAPSIAKRETTTTILSSIVAAACFYLVCSGVAYVAYCEQVPENVVDVWPLTWVPGSLARLFLAVELTMAAAGIYVPLGRAALWHLIYGPYERVATRGVTRTLVTLGLIAFGAVGSILLGGALALPLAVTSALCVTAQMFILPGLCVSELLKSQSGVVGKGSILGKRLAAIGFAAFGALFGLLSLAALFGIIG